MRNKISKKLKTYLNEKAFEKVKAEMVLEPGHYITRSIYLSDVGVYRVDVMQQQHNRYGVVYESVYTCTIKPPEKMKRKKKAPEDSKNTTEIKLIEIAKTTPYSYEEMRDAYVKLLCLSKVKKVVEAASLYNRPLSETVDWIRGSGRFSGARRKHVSNDSCSGCLQKAKNL